MERLYDRLGARLRKQVSSEIPWQFIINLICTVFALVNLYLGIYTELWNEVIPGIRRLHMFLGGFMLGQVSMHWRWWRIRGWLRGKRL